MSALHKTMDPLKVVILVGGRDFGRCPVASRLNRALWPVLGKPALQVLLDTLAEQGVKRFVISCENQSDMIRRAICWDEETLDVSFREETLPRGPAGCILDAAGSGDERLLVLPANIINPPYIEQLLKLHCSDKAAMTVFLNPAIDAGGEPKASDAQIYLCERTALEQIPEAGFFDIKEGLIPALVREGRTIASAQLPFESGHYRNWSEYAMQIKRLCHRHLVNSRKLDGFPSYADRPDVQVGSGVNISERAKLFGPVIIGSHSVIAGDAMIFGPTVIGENVTVAPGAVIEESVVWDKAVIGDNARIRYSLVDSGKTVPEQTEISGQLASCFPASLRKAVDRLQARKMRKWIRRRIDKRQATADVLTLSGQSQTEGLGVIGLAVFIFSIAALIFSYWSPSLEYLARTWMRSDEYSSGLLVPIVAVYVLWARRHRFGRLSIQPTLWGGIFLLISQLIRFFGLYHEMRSVEGISFVLSIGALVFFLFGWRVFKQFIPIFLFLFLMLPLPKQAESLITVRLQSWATASSVFCLETLGFEIERTGNIIGIGDTKVAVAEACNGLRMLTAFVVVSALVTLVTTKKWMSKAVILLSSIPIALICNTLRLTITAIAFTKLDTEQWEKVFHDFGGLAMMPVALLLIVGELWLLSRIVIEPTKKIQIYKQKQVIYRRKTKEHLIA